MLGSVFSKICRIMPALCSYYFALVAETARPADVMSTLDKCSNLLIMFPNITTLLKISATLPVSTATTERSFSSLRRLTTYLRTSMHGSRQTEWTGTYVYSPQHCRKYQSTGRVIDRSAKKLKS